MGIAGGREKSALYFVGISDSNNLIYLDPHVVRKSVPAEIISTDNLGKYVHEYHCQKMKKLQLDKMCTSVAIGFYIRDEADFIDFKKRIKELSR